MDKAQKSSDSEMYIYFYEKSTIASNLEVSKSIVLI
jgi:hypothetical protein